MAATTKTRRPALLLGGGYQDGGVLGNRLGLQLLRVASVNAAFRARRRPVSESLRPYVERFERDGVVLIEEFLPAGDFARMVAEIEAARAAGRFETKVEDDVLNETLNLSKHRDDLPLTADLVTSNERLLELAAAFTRVPAIDPKKLKIDVNFMSKRPGNVPPPEKKLADDHLHADTHYPSAKAWLYLNDIDESNGAFVYARGSKRLGVGRLAYEYDASVRGARAMKNGTAYAEVPIGVVREPSPRQLKAMGSMEEPVSGKANTLVFADVMGLHRRGKFEEGRTRAQIIFRFGDRPPERRPRS